LTVTQTTNTANGVQTGQAFCSTNKNFVFIHHGSTWIGTLTGTIVINSLWPLVSTPTLSTNGNDALNFASICSGAGLQTCVSNDPTSPLASPVPCNLTGPNAATTWKCYNEQLVCKDASFVNLYCASNPSWTPFQ
jgi:hypothetical protein